MNVANHILSHFADRLTTKRLVCASGLTPRMPALLAESLPPGPWLLVVDDNTWPAQGRALADALSAAGRPIELLNLSNCQPDRPQDLVCDAALVNEMLAAIGPRAQAHVCALIAVGSGTICDTVKLAAAATGLPSAAVATAPSMNGYPSIIAAVLRDGVKRTDPANPPLLVLADLDVLCRAPARMIAAGLADLLAKPVSTADWTLANSLLGEPISADGLMVVEQSALLGDDIAPELPARKPEAVARLFEALFVSGLAMAVSGASSPASGGEHLISHYLDMTGEHDLHGLQVGVGTLVAARLYHRLLGWDVASLDIAQRVGEQRPWPAAEAEIRSHFGPALAEAVIGQARKPYVAGDALAERLGRFKSSWPTLRPMLAARLTGPESIERELLACGAATHFAQIGVGRGRALAAVRFAHFVRARYTILHLLADLGVLESWSADAVR